MDDIKPGVLQDISKHTREEVGLQLAKRASDANEARQNYEMYKNDPRFTISRENDPQVQDMQASSYTSDIVPRRGN